MVSSDTKRCANCTTVQLRDDMMPILVEGMLRHVCNNNVCEVAFRIKQKAEVAWREQS